VSCAVHPRATGGEIKTIGLFPAPGETDDEAYARWATKRGEKCVCVGAPTPSQIAERAYDMAIAAAVDAFEGYDRANQKHVADYMAERRATILAALRQSVVSPDVIPWWRKP
jgi:hypothetical protein